MSIMKRSAASLTCLCVLTGIGQAEPVALRF